MADAALRRRCRDEQRAPSYRELVLMGVRRPWTERQIEAARVVVREFHRGKYGEPFTYALPVLCGRTWGMTVIPRCITGRNRLLSWAERVLRETAELEGA